MGIIIIISLLIVLFYSIAKIITGNSKKIHVGNLDAEISKDGKIAGNYNVLINGYELNIPINTSINEIEEHNRKANELENVTLSKYGNANIIDLDNGYIRVKWSYLNNTYIKNAIMDEDLFWKYNGIYKYIDIPKSKLEDMEKRRIIAQKKEEDLHNCARLNNQGIQYEQRGDIKSAISTYEENIKTNSYPARHSYDRLLILYRKQKDYENKKRVCLTAISMFSENKYKERLEKIEILINKNHS